MYRIAKQFRFSASHQLLGLPEDHQCSRLHGHNYEVWFILEGSILDAVGMVRDYGDLGPAKSEVEALDHRHLNDLLPVTTAECLAKFLYVRVKPSVPELVAVRTSETPTTWAEYSG